MVDGVGTNNTSNIQNQQQINDQTQVDGGDTTVNKTGKGVGGGDDLTVEKKGQSASDPVVIQDIDEKPDSNVDPTKTSSMQSLDDSGWNSSSDIFSLIFSALARAGDDQNELQMDANEQETADLKKYMDSQDKLAKDTTTLARNQAIAQTVAGAAGIAGGVTSMGASGNPALAGSINSVGSSSGGLSTSIEGIVDSGLQGDLKTDEKEVTVANTAMGKSGDLRRKHGDTFSKTMGAQDSTRQARQSVVNDQMSALKA